MEITEIETAMDVMLRQQPQQQPLHQTQRQQ